MSVTSNPQQYRLNAPLAVAEVIDGEAVIMNMDSGHYFSARGLAGVLWEWTIAGHDVDAMAAAVATAWRHDGIHDDVTAFVASLVSHNLVVPVTGTIVPLAPIDITLLTMPQYVTPVVDVFTDMQDLLLLDPIHDVGEAGWPMPLPAGQAGAA